MLYMELNALKKIIAVCYYNEYTFNIRGSKIIYLGCYLQRCGNV